MQKRMDGDGMASSMGLDPDVGDVSSLNTQALARHLLKTGLDPRIPHAKRKLSVDTSADDGSPQKQQCAAREPPCQSGLEMLCQLTNTAEKAEKTAGSCSEAAGSQTLRRDASVVAESPQDVAAALLSMSQME